MRYIEAILCYCESLCAFPGNTPLRGTLRDDVRTGLRITNYKKRAVIAFDVGAEQASIIGVIFGGQDYATILQEDRAAH